MNQLPIERLLNDLARPIRVWRFARGLLGNVFLSPGQYRGAEKRRTNALTEADAMIRRYVRENPE